MDNLKEKRKFRPKQLSRGALIVGGILLLLGGIGIGVFLTTPRGANENYPPMGYPPSGVFLNGAIGLDVVFLMDATGSMGDEIAQLRNNIMNISAQIDRLGVNVRYGLVSYRDRTDDYVTRVSDFTWDVRAFQATLNQLQASGGGDEPEALNEGLHAALNRMSWRDSVTNTVKLIFLVADAPPQLIYRDDVDYDQSLIYAASQGIKIHTIASSGLNPVGEFVLRQISQYTMGRFIFLTYDQGGAQAVPGPIGDSRPDLSVGTPTNPQDPQSQGDYTVEQLDEIVLRLIREELILAGAQSN